MIPRNSLTTIKVPDTPSDVLPAPKALIAKTTTTLDTNPVLSNISVPSGLLSETSTQKPLDRKHQDNEERHALHDHSVPIQEPSRPLSFSLNGNANFKRSSVYESNTTVKAIPIRNRTNSYRSHQYPEDKALPKSRSSSTTTSFSRSFLFGFYNNKKWKRNQKPSGILSKEYWMKDESVRECFACGKSFNTFRRKHHCRICGQIFCYNCTTLISGDDFGFPRQIRVCYNCWQHAENYHDSSDEEDYTASLHVPEEANGLTNLDNTADSDTNGIASIYHEEAMYGGDERDVQSIITSGANSKLFMSTPPPPPKMTIPATKQGASVEIYFNDGKPEDNSSKDTTFTDKHDIFTIKDIDNISPPKNNPYDMLRHTHSYMGNSRNKPGLNSNSLRKTLFTRKTPSVQVIPSDIINGQTTKNFKFQFNYHASNNDQLKRSQGDLRLSDSNFDSSRIALEASSSEDEGSMSIYSSLHDTRPMNMNPIRSTRKSTKSNQRAQASLQRIRFRRKSKSKSMDRNSLIKNFELMSQSSPNLLSVVDDEDQNFVCDTARAPTPEVLSKSMSKTRHNTPFRRLASLCSTKAQQAEKSKLNEVSTLHLNYLLDQVLNNLSVGSVVEWHHTLQSFLKKAQNIILRVKDSNTLDFRQSYVKIKRITGGQLSQSEYIDGIVFSKGLPNKNMSRYVENPRILLVMFPIEYQKAENQLLSIQSVYDQEKEYLNKLVSRLTYLNPDIIFCGSNVSGYALELIRKAGIIVQFNVKPQVLERISKLTDADIAVSVDKLASHVRMGECASFEVKTYIYGNISKTYTFLRGCNPDQGGTILLRGGDEEVLQKIKDVTEFMIYALFSLKLETAFFNDTFIQLHPDFYTRHRKKVQSQTEDGYFADFLTNFDKQILSVSPTVEFPPPYLLVKARAIRYQIQKERENYLREKESNDAAVLPQLIGIQEKLTLDLTKKLQKQIHAHKINTLESNFQKACRQWEAVYALSSNILGTGLHQSISLLYSMVSTKSATPCVGPQILTIDYFWDNDVSVGQFLENIIQTAFYPCKQGCKGLLLDHYRSYVHGSGKVDVLIEKIQTRVPNLTDIILTWSYCKNCGSSTPILQMGEKAWNFSFGKYLEILFWSNSESVANIGNCSHDFTKDHLRYFAYNNLVVRLEYSKVDVHELIMPQPEVTWQVEKDIVLKVKLYYQILDKINSFYRSVEDRIDRLKLDGISTDKISTVQDKITDLRSRLSAERKALLQTLEELYQESQGDQHLHLNSVVKELYENTVSWDADFSLFGQKYLPSDNDISQITTNQLKKMFNISEEKPKKTETLEPFKENESTSETLQHANSHKQEYESSVANKSNESVNNISDESVAADTALKSQGGGQNTTNNDAILPKAKIQEDGNMLKEHNKSTKVGKLASFFDQMHLDALSKEFELQRELRRLQLNKNKYQAVKLQDSTPIVEVYKDVKDAVADPLHDSIKRRHDKLELRPQDKQTHEDNSKVKLHQTLGDELESSIHLWGEKALKKSGGDPTSDKKESKTVEPLPPVTTTTTAVKDERAVAPEKSLLMKALANFWADRSASLWAPLDYPVTPTEHIFTDSNVIIREDEPSSLIAFCLSTADYKRKMEHLTEKDSDNTSVINPVINRDETLLSCNLKEQEAEKIDMEHSNEGIHLATFIPETKVTSATIGNNMKDMEQIMTKKTALHLRYQFADSSTVMSCKIFYAEHFEAFRRACGCDDKFIQSLSRCVKWDSNGGKSGSGFLKTLDNRFVIKELSHTELDAFTKCAPSYFDYMAQALFHKLPTVLAKVVGFYQIQVKNTVSGSKGYKLDLIIMENLFYEKKMSRIFDLKGSMHNRHVQQTGKANEVLLDENMVEYIFESPIHVREYDKKLLRASLWNDTLFLAKMNVMDYSLVVGIDSDKHTLTVGIIDFIRTFTWDKKLESWVKEKGLVGGNSLKKPTVVTPRQYKNRFREAMERYILMVPDPWYQDSI